MTSFSMYSVLFLSFRIIILIFILLLYVSIASPFLCNIPLLGIVYPNEFIPPLMDIEVVFILRPLQIIVDNERSTIKKR